MEAEVEAEARLGEVGVDGDLALAHLVEAEARLGEEEGHLVEAEVGQEAEHGCASPGGALQEEEEEARGRQEARGREGKGGGEFEQLRRLGEAAGAEAAALLSAVILANGEASYP